MSGRHRIYTVEHLPPQGECTRIATVDHRAGRNGSP
jgi:hypothetical protein